MYINAGKNRITKILTNIAVLMLVVMLGITPFTGTGFSFAAQNQDAQDEATVSVSQEEADAAESADDMDASAEGEAEGETEVIIEGDEEVPAAGAAEGDGSDADADADAEDAGEETPLAGELVYECDAFKVTAAFDEAAGIPEDAKLSVREITNGEDASKKDQKAYEFYRDKSLQKIQKDNKDVTELQIAKFYDITFLVDDIEITPSSDVQIKITYPKKEAEQISENKDKADADNLRILHFDSETFTDAYVKEQAGKDKQDAKVLPEVLKEKKTGCEIKDGKLTEATFEADSFSVYGVVYTVDDEYDDNKQTGKTETVVEEKGKTFRMEAAYDSDAGIPAEGARLSAKELKDDDPDTVTFDIKIVSEEDENVVYQPAEGHNVALTVVVLDNKADTDEDTTSVLHVCEDGTEEMLTADLEATDEGYVYSFETESFSTFTLYRNGTSSNERFITTVKTGRFDGSQTEHSGSARVSDNNEAGWVDFDKVIDKWDHNYSYSGSGGRYSVLKANDNGSGNRHQALCAIGFFEGYVTLVRSHLALGRFAVDIDTSGIGNGNVNGSATSYDLQIELNDNSLPVRITEDGTTTDKVFVPSGSAMSFTPESIAEELGYSTDDMVVSGKINNVSTDSVSRAQLTVSDVPTNTGTGNNHMGWWTRLLAGETFDDFGAGSALIALNTVNYSATNVSYPAAYKWTYNNGGTQTVIGDTPYEIKILPAVAQVSNDGGTTWKKFACLISGDYGGETLEGAFDYANSLSGDVVIELLKKGDDGTTDDTKFAGDTVGRYTLGSGFNFNNSAIDSLTINGVSDKSTLTKNQTTAPMITTTGIDKVEFNKIIFNGNDQITTNGNGGGLNTDATSLTVKNCEFKNCQAGYQGGGINHNNKAGTVIINDSTFTSCRANGPDDATGAGGGGVYTNAQKLTVTDSAFDSCTTKVRQGAGIFHQRAKTDPAGSEATFKDSTFKDCEAKWSGGGIESDAWNVTIENIEFTNCKATKGGAINVWADGQDSTSNDTTLNVTNCTFKNCSGTDNGGAVRSTSLHTNISDSSFEGCKTTGSTANGGAVACTSNKTITTVTDCTFTDCSSLNLGGAIFSAGTKANATTVSNTTITGGSARNGGAIRTGNVILNDVTITDCSATQQGGAVHSTQTITMNGGSVTGCTTSGDSAAVDAETSASGIVLSGDVVVAGNTGSSGEKRDVYIGTDTDRHILIASAGLGDGANIGVYTADANSVYENHGKPGKLFAHTGSVQASTMDNLDKLFNDRTIGDLPVLRGVAAVEGTSSNWKFRVMWPDYIARVSNDGGQTWTYHAYLANPADSPTQQNGATVKEGAFDQASTLTGDVIIETLYETHARYTVTRSTEFNKADTTYTLRTTQDSAWNPDGFTSKIYRGWNGGDNGAGAILYINNATTTFTTGDIILDGDKDGSVTGAARNGRAIYVNNGSLSANGNTTIRNFNMSGNGGAVYAAEDITYTISDTGNVLFDNCIARNGGAIAANKALTVTNNGGTLRFNECKTNGTGTNGLGGGIYANGALTITSTVIDKTTFTSCTANNGGGIYQNSSGNLVLTNVTFGEAGNDDKGCFAEVEGGSVYSKGTNTTVTDCSFYYSEAGSGLNDNNTHGGAVCHHGSGEHKILGCVFDHCTANTKSNEKGHGNGGAVYISEDGNILIIDKSDTRRSTFTNCSAYRYGGAVIFEMNDNGGNVSICNSDFEDCYTTFRDGGGVYSDSDTTLFEHCTFKRCHSDSDYGDYNGGGGIYMNGDTPSKASTITITDCQFEDCYVERNGGAIHFYSTGTNATLSNVQITGHNSLAAGTVNAELGSAVYSRGNITIKDSEIKECSASVATSGGAVGGAVNVAGNKTIFFEGSTVIRNNTNTTNDTGNEHNVILDQNNNTEIQTTATGIGASADIGIYVTGQPMGTPFKDHGSFHDDFGTYANGGSTANFDRFINDRVVDSNGDKLRGELCPIHTSTRLIRWTGVEPVSPTNVALRFLPFLLILLAGLSVLAVLLRRRELPEEDEEDEEEVVL